MALIAGVLAAFPVAAQEQVTFLPSLSVSETYNSNVFMVNPSFVRAGNLKTDDFITRVAPQIVALTDQDFGKANLVARGVFASYARYNELNYAGFNGGLNLNLNRMIQKVRPTAALQAFQGVVYTPVLPSFLGPPDLFSTARPDGDQSFEQSVFVRGLAVARQNAIVLTSSVAASDRVTPRTTVLARYQYDRAIFLGAPISSTAPQNFDSSYHVLTTGVGYQVTDLDKASISYTYTRAEFSDSNNQGARGRNFDSHGAGFGWTHIFSPSWYGSATVGGALVQPSNQLYQTYNINLFYTGQLTVATLSYQRVITPSFTTIGSALVSEIASGGFSYRLGSLVWGGASAAYTRNEFVTTAKEKFFSYGGNAFLAYRPLTWLVTSLNYGYGFFNQVAVGSENTFQQHAITLNLTIGTPDALVGAGGTPGMYR